MKRDEAIAKWKQACPAVESKGRFVRNGNFVSIEFALRHKDCVGAEVTVVEQDGSTILKIEPKPVDPKTVPAGKSASKRPAFHLIVV
jgi:hypothetical protein